MMITFFLRRFGGSGGDGGGGLGSPPGPAMIPARHAPPKKTVPIPMRQHFVKRSASSHGTGVCCVMCRVLHTDEVGWYHIMTEKDLVNIRQTKKK